jgi:GT2 family glycosyltransferase
MLTKITTDETQLVSVICRSIGRRELKQALDSIASQTYSNLEIVLVQASQKPLSEFANSITGVPVNLVVTGKNLSRSDAANAGLDAANGSLILFLDDDDWLADDHVEHLVEFLNANPKILAAYSSTQKISADGTVKKETFTRDFDPQLLMHENYIPIHSMLFSRSLLEHSCRFDSNFDIFEDWDFWLQLSQHSDFAHVDKITAFYREGGDSATASTSPEALERYSGEGAIAKGRAKLFSKWLKIWDGSTFNKLVGTLDKSNAIHTLNQTIAEQEGKANALNAQKQNQLDDLNSELEVAYTKLHETNLQNESLAAKLASTEQEAQALKANLHNKEVQVQNSSRHIEELEVQVQNSSRHIEELEGALQAVFDSTSWRLMEPFRRIVRVTRNLVSGRRQATSVSSVTAHSSPSAKVVEKRGAVHFAIDKAVATDGFLYIRGWACATPAIEKIELSHKAVSIPVSYGGARDDIARAYPLISSARHSGFSFFAEVSLATSYQLKLFDPHGLREGISFSPDSNTSLSQLSDSGELYVLDAIDQYRIYRLLNKHQNPDHKDQKSLSYTPLISIIVPVFNVSKQWLDACIESVVNQTYSNWELCLHDDASTNQETLDCLAAWQSQDTRIKVQYGQENQHISGASNSALDIAQGEFIGLMDNDDELASDALYWVIDAINSNPQADYLYTDEDKIDEDGNYCQPHFKPDWSPEMLESMMYVGHFGVIRRSVIDKVGGFRIGYEGSQDFDLTLRISQVSQNFVHIPRILYHWRIIPGSVAGGSDQKSYAYTSGFKALQDHVNANGKKAKVSTTATPGLYRVSKQLDNPRVAIIMPFHNKAEMTLECLQSILRSSYTNYEVVLISNNSNEQEYEKVAHFVDTLSVASVLKHDIPFNWSALNNWGSKQVNAHYYLFLNNDMKVISEDWIESLLSCAVDETIGAVGAKLLYEDNTVQHAGIVMHLGGVAGHPFKGLPGDHPGYFGYAEITRNVAAITGACLLVKKQTFERAERFDETLGVAYNDVDFCLRLIELGLRNVYTPFAKLYHFESKTRPKTPADMNQQQRQQFEQESAFIMQRHAKYFEDGDPYYNKALTLKLEDYSIKL